MEKYNGYTNRDTWLVALWLFNDYNNYELLKKYVKVGYLPSAESIKVDFKYNDHIDFSNVNLLELHDLFIEMLTE